MDEVLVAAGVTVPLIVALAGAIWWLVTSSRQNRRKRQAVATTYARRYRVEAGFMGEHDRPAHRFRGQGEAVTVAELIEEAVEHGEGIRLNWPDENLAEAGRVRPDVEDQFPTVILPQVENDR